MSWIKRGLFKIKLLFLKMRGGGAVRCGRGLCVHPSMKLAVRRGGSLVLRNRVTAASQTMLLVERGARLMLGRHVSLSRGVQIVCHDQIEIGAETMLANNVMIFDHDHDFRAPGGLAERKYRTAPVVIGKNVWIGANAVILRGTTIGDNAVVGAGCVVKGEVPASTVLVQKRTSEFLPL